MERFNNIYVGRLAKVCSDCKNVRLNKRLQVKDLKECCRSRIQNLILTEEQKIKEEQNEYEEKQYLEYLELKLLYEETASIDNYNKLIDDLKYISMEIDECRYFIGLTSQNHVFDDKDVEIDDEHLEKSLLSQKMLYNKIEHTFKINYARLDLSKYSDKLFRIKNHSKRSIERLAELKVNKDKIEHQLNYYRLDCIYHGKMAPFMDLVHDCIIIQEDLNNINKFIEANEYTDCKNVVILYNKKTEELLEANERLHTYINKVKYGFS